MPASIITTGTPSSSGLSSPSSPSAKRKIEEKFYTTKFETFKNSKPGLEIFYNDAKLKETSQKAKVMGDKLQNLGCGPEPARDLSLLTLYDIVLLLDDSASMAFEQDGKRITVLEQTLREITKVYDLANDTGILSVKFLNNPTGKRNVTETKVGSIFQDRIYEGHTQIGTMLQQRVLQPFVWKNPMKKPLLVMVITDGEVEGEYQGLLKQKIKECIKKIKADSERGAQAVSFHFSRVGDDEGAKMLLGHLQECDELKPYVDCLEANQSLEQLEVPSYRWILLCKLFLGAIDPKWGKMKIDPIEGEVEEIVFNNAPLVEDEEEDED